MIMAVAKGDKLAATPVSTHTEGRFVKAAVARTMLILKACTADTAACADILERAPGARKFRVLP